jgi:carbon-monoxide dehydrogenase medium subunit
LKEAGFYLGLARVLACENHAGPKGEEASDGGLRMKPAPFEYLAPRSIEEAVHALAEHGEEAKVLAGGQSLVPMMNFRLASPAVLIDLNGVTELEYAREDGDTLVLGALARHRDVQDLASVRQRCAMVAEGVDLIGHQAIRNRGTVGGSLAHADPAAEWPALLASLDGEVDAVGPNGRRTIAAAELFVTYFTTALEPDEIVVEARLPLVAGGRVGSTFVEFAQRHGDFALAGVGALVKMTDESTIAEARITLIGVRDVPVRARAAEAELVGARPDDGVIEEAARAIQDEIDPVSDLHGSADYRRHVAEVLTRRALAIAVARAA